MYLLVKCGSYMSYGNGEMNSYVSSYMNTLEKGELIASVPHFDRSSKSGIPVYNSGVPDRTARKTRRKNTQATVKRYGFPANTTNNYSGFK